MLKKLTLTTLLFTLTLAPSCSSPRDHRSGGEKPGSDTTGTLLEAYRYEDAISPKAFGLAVLDDIEAGHASDCFYLLERLVSRSVVAGEATYLHMMYEQGNVAKAFLLSSVPEAKRFAHGVKEQESVLAGQRNEELAAVYEHLANQELAKVEKALRDPKGNLNPTILEHADGLQAHAHFFEGILGLNKAMSAPALDTKAVEAAMDYLARAEAVFSTKRQGYEAFLCRQAIAHATESFGSEEEIAEAWLATRASAYFSKAPKDLRDGIEQKIEAYRLKLLREVESAVAEAHAKEKRDLVHAYEQRLAEASATQERLESEVLSKSEELEKLKQLGNIDWNDRPGMFDGLTKNLKVYIFGSEGLEPTAGQG